MADGDLVLLECTDCGYVYSCVVKFGSANVPQTCPTCGMSRYPSNWTFVDGPDPAPSVVTRFRLPLSGTVTIP